MVYQNKECVSLSMKIKYEDDSDDVIELNNAINYDLELGIALSESLHQTIILSPILAKKKIEDRLFAYLKDN